MTIRGFCTHVILYIAGLGGYIWQRITGRPSIHITRYAVPTSKIPRGERIKILHMSDFHASPHVPIAHISSAVSLGLEYAPDIICLTGDFITTRICQYEAYSEILHRLSDYAPTYACLGNHDGGVWSARGLGYDIQSQVMDLLKRSGISCLINESSQLILRNTDIEITGLGDLWSQQAYPEKAFCAENGHRCFRIVLAHNPDTAKMIYKYRWDLLLCGHTHGGQIVLPYFGMPYLPIKNRKYCHGLHHDRGRYIHITKGVGDLFGVRINCPPEMGILTLKTACA